MKTNNLKSLIFYISVCNTIFLVSCEKFVTVELPKNKIISSSVFLDDKTATAAVTGIYSEIMGNNNSGFSGGESGISLITGTSADELVNLSPLVNRAEFYENNLTSTNSTLKDSFWDPGFKYIYYANSILEGLEKSDLVTPATKRQLEGEARFIRAYCNFYLFNLFGEIPLITSTDYRINIKAYKAKTAAIFERVVSDLLLAQELLAETYVTAGRVRPNKSTATALLARVYLYKHEWQNAEDQSSKIIENNTVYALETNLDNVFLADSKEAIFQFKPVAPGLNTYDGQSFIFTPNAIGSITLTQSLEDAFTEIDQRKAKWINVMTVGGKRYAFPTKYKIKTGTEIKENYSVLRLAEQYLIRAEARVKLGDLIGASQDLNVVRKRAGLGDTPTAIGSTLLLAIEAERRLEMFSEWGHRWFDLKRTNRIDAVLGTFKGNKWSPSDAQYPLPQTDVSLNPNLEIYEN